MSGKTIIYILCVYILCGDRKIGVNGYLVTDAYMAQEQGEVWGAREASTSVYNAERAWTKSQHWK